jgi:hypothetical protein
MCSILFEFCPRSLQMFIFQSRRSKNFQEFNFCFRVLYFYCRIYLLVVYLMSLLVSQTVTYTVKLLDDSKQWIGPDMKGSDHEIILRCYSGICRWDWSNPRKPLVTIAVVLAEIWVGYNQNNRILVAEAIVFSCIHKIRFREEGKELQNPLLYIISSKVGPVLRDTEMSRVQIRCI